MNRQSVPLGLRDSQNRDVVVSVEAKARDRQRKEASVSMLHPAGGGTYTIVSDEGTYLGGLGKHPSPLQFFSVAIAF